MRSVKTVGCLEGDKEFYSSSGWECAPTTTITVTDAIRRNDFRAYPHSSLHYSERC